MTEQNGYTSDPPQTGPGYGDSSAPPPPPPTSPPGHNKAIASLVLGIIAVLSIFTGIGAVAGIALGVVGLVLGISAKNEAASSMATAGIVLNLVATCIAGIVFISCIACLGCSALPAFLY